MASDAQGGNRLDDQRHIYGPRPLGALVPQVTRPTFRRRAPAAAQVMADWPTLVGPALAAVTAPRRLAGGTLTIACAGPVALELQHLSGMLIERINTGLGRQTIERLRFVQEAVEALVPPPAAVRPPDPAVAAATERALRDVPEGPLRDALRALGQTVKGAARDRRA